jgi:hypothetical protein
MHLVMFDIDGTLVDSAGFETRLYVEAVRSVLNVAKCLVERLLELPHVRVGIATGGWEQTAKLKLAHVGIDVGRLGFASSSDALARTDIMELAAQRAMRGSAYTRATYFGDGVWAYSPSSV